jgi:subtilisin family serine protease
LAAKHRRRNSDCHAPGVPWGLDRIDDKSGRDGSYSSGKANPGSGVHVFVLDTGIRFTHLDFEGRAKPFYDAVTDRSCESTDESCAYDRAGHGTHCAGTIGGKTQGVANKVSLWSVKVLGDDGPGSSIWVLQGFDQVIHSDKRPAVISMSLGGEGNSLSMKTAINTAVTDGITVVVAAGNDNKDACNYMPAFVPNALTVGSVTKSDQRSDFSNYGSCLDIWAPGSNILSAGIRDDLDLVSLSGTSMACPHVSGAAALLLGGDKSLTPAEVRTSLLSSANIKSVKSGSTDKMLYVR